MLNIFNQKEEEEIVGKRSCVTLPWRIWILTHRKWLAEVLAVVKLVGWVACFVSYLFHVCVLFLSVGQWQKKSREKKASRATGIAEEGSIMMMALLLSIITHIHFSLALSGNCSESILFFSHVLHPLPRTMFNVTVIQLWHVLHLR